MSSQAHSLGAKQDGRRASIGSVDPIWSRIRDEAEDAARAEPALASLFFSTILNEDSLEAAVCNRLSARLEHLDVPGELIRQAFEDALDAEPEIGQGFRADIAAVFDRDPACNRMMEPVLYFKGFHALQTHRLAHRLWQMGRHDFAYLLQSRCSSVYGVDIHPAARVGRGIMVDHGHGIVVGETAVIGDNVSLLHGVTLGGSGKESGDRHPKIADGVLIGAGAKILGNLDVGTRSRIAAGSVVLKSVPTCVTVAGVPARIVGRAGCDEPSRAMDHRFDGGFMDEGSHI